MKELYRKGDITSSYNHFPMVIDICQTIEPKMFYFKFGRMWLKREDLIRCIKDWWKEVPKESGTKSYVMQTRLSHIKAKLKD